MVSFWVYFFVSDGVNKNNFMRKKHKNRVLTNLSKIPIHKTRKIPETVVLKILLPP